MPEYSAGRFWQGQPHPLCSHLHRSVWEAVRCRHADPPPRDSLALLTHPVIATDDGGATWRELNRDERSVSLFAS